jgi:hypothetical protein
MGGRKQKMKEPKSGIYIIGEGITEQYYFSHIKRMLGFNCIYKAVELLSKDSQSK